MAPRPPAQRGHHTRLHAYKSTLHDVDEAAIRASPLVQAEIKHNSGLRATATMDAYAAALRAGSACRAPDADPFAIGTVIADPRRFGARVDANLARSNELSRSVAERLAHYLPPDYEFTGSVVLAVPYFCCGGLRCRRRSFYDANARRMRQNYAVMNALLDRVAAARGDYAADAKLADSILFSGEFEEIGCYVGAQMLTDVDRARGRAALMPGRRGQYRDCVGKEDRH
jgi:hypothetical protein